MSIVQTCKTCEQEFTCDSKKQKYCSEWCKINQKITYVKICKFCQKYFKISKYDIESERKKFCSTKCQYAFAKSKPKITHELTIKNCVFCNKEIHLEFYKRRNTYCSPECFYNSRIGSTLTQEHCNRISETRKLDWASGKYQNHSIGKTKWHDHVTFYGEKIRLQGTWEVLYAQYLDDNKIHYNAHKGAIWYIRSSDNTKRVYLPDFYLPNSDEYLDVKNDYLLKVDAQKLKDIQTCNPTLKLKIITKQILVSLNLLKS